MSNERYTTLTTDYQFALQWLTCDEMIDFLLTLDSTERLWLSLWREEVRQ